MSSIFFLRAMRQKKKKNIPSIIFLVLTAHFQADSWLASLLHPKAAAASISLSTLDASPSIPINRPASILEFIFYWKKKKKKKRNYRVATSISNWSQVAGARKPKQTGLKWIHFFLYATEFKREKRKSRWNTVRILKNK